MNAIVREYKKEDVPAMRAIWNEVVAEGVAFPQMEELTQRQAEDFFANQSRCGVAEEPETGRVVGLYILHPNNVGPLRTHRQRQLRRGGKRPGPGGGGSAGAAQSADRGPAGLSGDAVQRRGGGKPPGPAAVREVGVPTAGSDSRRLPDEGRPVCGHLSLL